MRREDIEKLLGGYAAGSLTPLEREQLFAAALEDQTLFDQLAAEEPLRAALSDPAARAQLLAALEEVREPWPRRFAHWLGRPAGLAAMAGTAAAVLTVGVLVNYRMNRVQPALVTGVRQQERRPDVAPPAAGSAQPPQAPVPAEPAEAPRLKVAAKKAAVEDTAEKEAAKPSVPAPRQARGQAAGVVGGVPGGVIGGILPRQEISVAPLPPPPPPPAKVVEMAEARNQAAAAPPAAAPLAEPNARVLFDSTATSAFAREEAKDGAAQPFGAGPARRMAAGQLKRAEVPAPALASAVSVPHLGLRYTILRMGAGGGFAEIDPTTVFARGDQLRLAFEANDTGYLYVLQREAGGGWRLLAGERVGRRARLVVPSDGALTYDEPGARQLYVFFSRTPQPFLASPDPRALDDRVRDRQVVQKGENGAMYVVNTGGTGPSQQVGHTIVLSFR